MTLHASAATVTLRAYARRVLALTPGADAVYFARAIDVDADGVYTLPVARLDHGYPPPEVGPVPGLALPAIPASGEAVVTRAELRCSGGRVRRSLRDQA